MEDTQHVCSVIGAVNNYFPDSEEKGSVFISVKVNGNVRSGEG